MTDQRSVKLARREEVTNSIAEFEDVHRLLELFVKSTEYRTRQYIEPIVTEALEYVFDDGLDFRILFVTRRNQIEVDFLILRTAETRAQFDEWSINPEGFETELEALAKETKDINYMYGGSVNQVIAMVLRFVIAELLKVEGPIVLDEPTSAVDENRSSRLGRLIASLSTRFNRQYIFITHSTALASFANKKIRVTKNGKESTAAEDTW